MDIHIEGDEEKVKRMKGKIEDFIANEIAPEMVDSETQIKLEETIKNIFKQEKIPDSVSSWSAFIEGIDFAMSGFRSAPEGGASQVMLMTMILKQKLKERKANLAKKVDEGISNKSSA